MTDKSDETTPIPAQPALMKTLTSLDMSQFSTFARMKPSTANLPPNSSQKDYLRKHAAESHILLKISALWMSNQVKRLIFSPTAVATLGIYLEQSGVEMDSALNMFELAKLRELHAKAGIEMDLRAFDPPLFGIPTSIQEGLPVGSIEAHLHDGAIVNFGAQTVEDADSIFKHGNVADCFLFAFFYLLDQRVLLEGRRERGQLIPRFLRIYASHTMNQILFAFFEPFMNAYRALQAQGFTDDEITIAAIATAMTNGAE